MWSKITVENLLSDWLREPYQCARGGICYSCRYWKHTHHCVVSLHPNARGWSDPATYKLFADIRALGWGLVTKQVEWASIEIREVILIPPPERRYLEMDRPSPIFDHAGLGTREPNDPELRGYNPGHPRYYLMGGRPLRPEEIEPDFEWELPTDVRLDNLKNPAKREKRLLEMRAEFEKSVQSYIQRYEEVINPGFEISSFDRNLGYGLETSIYLRHNHVLSSKAWLSAINRELGKYRLPVSTPTQKILWREWGPTPVSQVKGQLSLF